MTEKCHHTKMKTFRFVNRVMEYDGVLVRFTMGQLDGQGMPPGAQKRFDHAMDTMAIKGKAVWSNPAVSRSMGAKDSLVKIKDLKVGLPVRVRMTMRGVQFEGSTREVRVPLCTSAFSLRASLFLELVDVLSTEDLDDCGTRPVHKRLRSLCFCTRMAAITFHPF